MSSASRARRLVPEASKFLTVGALAYVVDTGVFNLVLFGSPSWFGEAKPLTAKTISTVLATLVAYFGNKSWTYSHKQGQRASRELLLFLMMNAAAMLIALACLGISHYVFGFTSAVADNIAANVIGVGLGTVFRFFTYRSLVFLD